MFAVQIYDFSSWLTVYATRFPSRDTAGSNSNLSVVATGVPSDKTMLESIKCLGSAMRSRHTLIPIRESGIVTRGCVNGRLVDSTKSTCQSEYAPARFVR